MQELIEKPNKPKTGRPSKTSPKARGRKPSRAPRHKTPAGRGAAHLRSSANTMVDRESDNIVQALIKKTIAGNMTGARILVELTSAQNPPPEKKKKRRRPSWIQLLASEPEWNPSMENAPGGNGAITTLEDGTIHRDASKLPPSEPDDSDDEEGDVFVPALYPRTHESGDDQVKLGRMTDWRELEGGAMLGVGLHTFLRDEDDVSLLEWREWRSDQEPAE